ncbi:MAG: hypothetical protein MZU97_12085 [Bacillus subtilis]|nr:hypothetical protein [Bacillus subtilis]
MVVGGICLLLLLDRPAPAIGTEGPGLDTHFRLKTAAEARPSRKARCYSEQNLQDIRGHPHRRHRLQDPRRVRQVAFPAHRVTPTSSTPSPASRTRTTARAPLFLDIFFIEPDPDPDERRPARQSHRDESGRVFLETVLHRPAALDGRAANARSTAADGSARGWARSRTSRATGRRSRHSTASSRRSSRYGRAHRRLRTRQLPRGRGPDLPAASRWSLKLERPRRDHSSSTSSSPATPWTKRPSSAWPGRTTGRRAPRHRDPGHRRESLERAQGQDAKSTRPCKVEDIDQDGTPGRGYYIVRQYQRQLRAGHHPVPRAQLLQRKPRRRRGRRSASTSCIPAPMLRRRRDRASWSRTAIQVEPGPVRRGRQYRRRRQAPNGAGDPTSRSTSTARCSSTSWATAPAPTSDGRPDLPGPVLRRLRRPRSRPGSRDTWRRTHGRHEQDPDGRRLRRRHGRGREADAARHHVRHRDARQRAQHHPDGQFHPSRRRVWVDIAGARRGVVSSSPS